MSLSFYFKFFYIQFKKYINKKLERLFTPNVKLISNNIYEIKYKIKNKTYKMLVKEVKGPCDIISIKGKSNKDYTDLLLSYIGPSNSFIHNINPIKHIIKNETEVDIEKFDGINKIKIQ